MSLSTQVFAADLLGPDTASLVLLVVVLTLLGVIARVAFA
jgi:hypothetical protein